MLIVEKKPLTPFKTPPLSLDGFELASKPQAHIAILGIRGVPAAHGGFETFAENLAPYLVKKGHKVTVYCQDDTFVGQKPSAPIYEDEWQGVRRVHIRVSRAGALGTMEFDALCIKHAIYEQSIKLVLGYNTGIFTAALRLKGHKVITNMDGIEWKRSKWSWKARAWFYLNEWASAFISTKMIADHPEIANHLAWRRSRNKTVMIPYGADPVTQADPALIEKMGLKPNNYFISIARIEKENSILEMVKAFSQAKRNMNFVVLGKFEPDNAYHNAIKQAASNEVLFVGAIYNQRLVQALRFHARAYCHGHTVGGTNPSLVESLMAGNAVIAHNNKFNRWTAGDDQFFFNTIEQCAEHFHNLSLNQGVLNAAKFSALLRAKEDFQWEKVLSQYETLLCEYVAV